MRRESIPVTKISKDYVAESILKALPKVRGLKILIPRAQEAREILPRELKKKGALVRVVTAYRTRRVRESARALGLWLNGNVPDCVTFTSSSTVKNFFKSLAAKAGKEIVRNPKVLAASIGPITTQTLKSFGWKPAIVAKKPTTGHLAQPIAQHFKKGTRHERH